jgi:hypothetical protein
MSEYKEMLIQKLQFLEKVTLHQTELGGCQKLVRKPLETVKEFQHLAQVRYLLPVSPRTRGQTPYAHPSTPHDATINK